MKWIWRILAVLVAIPLLCAAVLWAMGMRGNAGHTHVSIEVHASPSQVWPWLEEPGRLKLWVSWLVEVRDQSPAPAGVGGRRIWVMRDQNNGGALMEIPFTYTEYAPPTRMTVHTSMAGMFEGSDSYRLTDLGNGATRIESDGRFRYNMWMARLMEPVITPRSEAKMNRDFARLKELIDRSPGH